MSSPTDCIAARAQATSTNPLLMRLPVHSGASAPRFSSWMTLELCALLRGATCRIPIDTLLRDRRCHNLESWGRKDMLGKPITTLIPPDRDDEEPEILDRIRRG